jgi:hypothetical protein
MGLILAGVAGFLILGLWLEDGLGIPFDTTYRVGCAGACLILMAKAGLDYREERWPKIALSLAMLVTLGLFLTPLVDRPASRGEIMLFALPDAIIFLTARIAAYQVTDAHRRAVRQQLILAAVSGVVLCAILFALTLMQPPGAR